MRSLLKTALLLATLGFAGNISYAQITGAVSVPSTTYPDLASVVTALNTQGVGTGGATINIAAGQTAPTGGYKLGSATLNASLSAANPLTINGNGNVITPGVGTGAADGVFYLQGTDYVTIDKLSIVEAATNLSTTTQMEFGYALVKLNSTAPFDGCQNVSITNSKVALVATNTTTKGIYLFHSVSASPTTSLAITGAGLGDANSYNTFAGDTLQNCTYGIYQYGMGSTVANYDRANQIGTASNGNVFNTGGSTSSAYGVYTYYDSILTIQNNKFNIATGHNAYVYQIYPNVGKGNLTITNNAYNISSTITTGYVYGLYNYGITTGTGHYDATGTFTFSGNTFTGSNTTATSSYFYEMYNYYTPWGTIQINNNVENNITYSGTGYMYGLYSYYNACNNFTATGNSATNITRTSLTGGYVYGGYFYQYNATGGTMNVSNNTYNTVSTYGGYGWYTAAAPSLQTLTYKYNKFINVTGLGAGSFYPMYTYYGSNGEIAYDSVYNVNTGTGYVYNYFAYYNQAGNVHDNYFSDITIGGSGWYYGYMGYYSNNDTVHDNVIKNITQSGTGSLYVMYPYGAYGGSFYQNKISNINAATGTIYGIYTYAQSGAPTNFYNNNLSGLNITGATSSGTVYGMYLGGGTGTSVNIYNNFITGITVPATYTYTNLYGVYLSSSMTYNLYHNTIRLAPVGSATQFGVTGIYYSSAATSLDLRNNIVYIDALPAGTGTVVAVRRSAGTTGTAPTNLASTSNGNVYFAPNITNSYLYGEGTSSTAMYNTYNLTIDPAFNTPCGLYKTFMAPRESASFTEKNLPAGTLANTFVPTGVSYAKSVGVSTSSPAVTFDYNNVTRPASNSDAGALQFTGTALDAAAPQINYTALPATSYCTTAPTVVATITDATGVNTTTGTAPRIYYKKSTDANAFGVTNTSAGNGWKYVEGTNVGSTFTFPLNYALLQSAPAAGDLIQYFIVAQDVVATPNVGASIAAFPSTYCPTSVALPAAAGPLNAAPAPYSFSITSLPTAFTVGQTYKSLCNSGTTTLSLTPAPSGTAVQWQQSVGGGAFTNISGATSASFTTPLLTTTTVFRAQLYCGGSVTATSTADTIVVANPALLTTTPATRCGVGPITLNATTSTGSTVNWYANATSPTVLYTGNAYSIPSLGATTTYYAAASVANANTEVVGKTVKVAYSNYYPSGPYGVTIALAATSTIYSTTVYPAGAGTFQIQLLDANNSQVTGTSTLNITINPSDVGTAMVIPLNFQNIPAGTYKISTTSTYTGTPTMNIEYLASNFPYPYVSPSGNASVTNSQYSTTNYLYYYYFFYNIVVSGPCSSARVPVVATVTTAPAITASSPNVPGICTGATATMMVTSNNAGYSYSWTPGGQSGQTIAVSPTATTTYVVTATDNSTGTNAGCIAKDSVLLYVNAQPAAPVITPATSTICQGSQVTLTSNTGSGSPTIFSENFTNATTASPGIFTITTGAGNTNTSALGPWQVVTAPYTNSGSSSETFGGSGNKYIHGDGNSQNALNNTIFTTTNSYSTVGYTSLSLSYNQYYQTYGGDSANVDVSTNNGATWTTVYNQAGTTVGTGFTAFAPNTINLNAYLGVSQLKVRFHYYTTYGWYWAVDDIVLSGTPLPIATNWQNVTSLYKNTGLTQAVSTTDTNKVVYAAPSVTQVYTAIANNQGCLSPVSNTATVNVNPAPNAAIAASPSATICAGQTTTLTAGQTGTGYTYQWSNAGGAIAGATGNTYTTGTAGTYKVTVTNTATGCIATTATATTVIVNPLPTATATASGATTVCNGNTVQLNANTGTGLTYQWLNNGSPVTGATSAIYYASTTGNYAVVVTNPNTCSATSSQVSVTVNTTPAVITPQGTTTFCTGYNVVLQANTGANLTYVWQLNGSAISGATGSSYTASTTGNYTVIVTNTATTCVTTSAPVTVTVGAPPTSNITPAGAVGVCDGNSLTLTTNTAPGLTYQWYLNGTAIAGANGQTYTRIYNTGTGGGGGSYTANVSSGVGCSSTTATPTVVTVNPLPVLTATAGGATTFCQGNTVTLTATPGTGLTYQWYNGTTAITGATATTYAAGASGSYTVRGTNSNGCIGTSNAVNVTVNPLPTVTATAATATTFCQNGSVVLNAAPTTGLTYQWTSNTTNISGATASSYSATASGNYAVRVTNSNGCVNTSNVIPVTVNPLPNVTLTPAGNINVCSGATTTISVPAAAGQTYQWSNGGGAITGATAASYTTGTAGVYSTTVTITATGCQATSGIDSVVVNPLPTAVASIAGPTTICQGDTAKLSGNGGAGYTYQWRLNGNSIVGATAQTYNAIIAGTYTVAVTNVYGCTVVSNGIVVIVNPAPPAYITYATPLSFCDGGAVVLNANAGTGLTYNWLLNGAPVGNTTASNISTQQGAYSIKVTNTYGCSTISAPEAVTVWQVTQPVITMNNFLLSTGTYATYQWFFNNNPMPGAVTQSVTPVGNGFYKVMVHDAHQCTATSEQFFVNGLGISSTAAVRNAIKVYPNPASGILHIDAPVKVNVALRDVTGRTVMIANGVKEIDVTAVANGVYVLYINDTEGHTLKVEKVTKTND